MKFLNRVKNLTQVFGFAGAFALAIQPARAQSPNELVIYSAQRGIWMGDKTEMPPMDYYLTLGKNHGATIGSTVEVLRRVTTYDVINRKLHKDLTFAIAKLKIIHTETHASIARLETLVPIDKRPSLAVNAVSIGDLVRLTR